MKGIARFLVGLFMPLFLIGGGAGLIGLGMTYEIVFLIWVGFALIAAGIVWGVIFYLLADNGGW